MGLISSIGSFFNDISGATSAAKLNHQYQKEFAKNAHQWEVKDLQKAGLNPVLSAGGSGASASGGGSSAQASMGITDVANSASNLIGTLSGKEKNDADIKNTNADTAGKLIENNLITPKAEAEIKQAYSTMAVNSAEKALKEEQKKYTGYFPTTIANNQSGPLGVGGGTSTTVYSKGGKIRINGRHTNRTHN